MSDEEEVESAKYRPRLSLMPSMEFQSEYSSVTPCSKPAPKLRPEDQNFSFMDLTDDVASLAARRGFA